MTGSSSLRVSLMLSSAVPPSQTQAVAAFAERSGYHRLWITEDYFRKGAFATAGAVLAATERLQVGLGVTSAYVRHPTVLAMEVATLEAMFPGRFQAGLGMGSRRALQTIERVPDRAIASLRDRIRMLRSLLAGERVQWRDQFDAIGESELEYPAAAAPLWLAAESPQMLRLAARESDGLILSAFSSPGYVSWVREQITEAVADRRSPLPVTAFVYTSLAADEQVAYQNAVHLLSQRLAGGHISPTIRHSDHWEELEPLVGLPPEQIQGRLRPETVASFVNYGTVEMCRARLDAYATAGVDEVAVSPIPVQGKLDLAAVMPLLEELPVTAS